ncbi:MAG: AraC family transcriptional regulator [Chitinophagales bacterium]|nr:AraC family transcriptional regulator [Chitinophagales bacterium]
MMNVEKAKKMLLDDSLTLSEIAKKLNYDSLQVMSSEFKKLVGMTPARFKRLNYDPNKDSK